MYSMFDHQRPVAEGTTNESRAWRFEYPVVNIREGYLYQHCCFRFRALLLEAIGAVVKIVMRQQGCCSLEQKPPRLPGVTRYIMILDYTSFAVGGDRTVLDERRRLNRWCGLCWPAVTVLSIRERVRSHRFRHGERSNWCQKRRRTLAHVF